MAKWTNEQHKKYFLRSLNKTVKKYVTDAIVEYVDGNEIGFTDGKIIHINWNHPIFDELSITDKKRVLRGVFAHELLHLLYTNFLVLKNTINKMEKEGKNPVEIRVLASINNLMEDPFIEHNAHRKFGGTLLRDLRFCIRYLYDKTEPLTDDMSAFSQYESALIMFGDMGVIKGRFSDSQAAECFSKSAGIFYDNLSETSAYGRMDNAFKLLEISRPLWEKMVEDAKKAMEELKEALKRAFISELSEDSDSEGDEMPESDKKPSASEKRMKKLVKKLEEASESGEESDDGSDGSSDDGDSLDAASDIGSDEASDKSLDETSDGNEDTSDDTSDSTSDSPDDTSKDSGGDIPDSSDPSETPESGSKPDSKSSVNSIIDEALTEAMEELESEGKELETSDSDKEAEEAEQKDGERAEKSEKENSSSADLDPSVGTLYDKDTFSVLNVNVSKDRWKSSYSTMFRRMENEYKGTINGFIKRMKRIFANVSEDRQYGKKGKLSVKRYYGPKATTNIFRKKVEPEDISDLAIMILVDESGSMGIGDCDFGKTRARVSRELAASLAKSFITLDIPIYVMGYTGEEHGYDAEHYHYVKWNKSRKDLESIMAIDGKAQNFDSFSFSCGNEILSKRKEEHKLVIIISDGSPCCCLPMDRVGDHKKLLSDTSLAIRELRRQAEVISVCVGDYAPSEQLKFLYGKNFFSINSTEKGFLKISNEIEKIVKKW